MATYEEKLTLSEEPQAALATCARALALAGFKNIQTHDAAKMVTAQKRSWAQWTATQVVLLVEPVAEGSRVTVQSQATAQSLSALAVPPAQKIVGQAIAALQSRA